MISSDLFHDSEVDELTMSVKQSVLLDNVPVLQTALEEVGQIYQELSSEHKSRSKSKSITPA
jgi:hypothetical protein